MKFEWWISNDRITIHIKLLDDFVLEAFYQLLDRLNTNNEQNTYRNGFKQYKTNLSQQLWQQPLGACPRIETVARKSSFESVFSII